MKPYHKIQTVLKRDPPGGFVNEGQYATPEFEYLAENQWIWTEKVDGRNTRVMWREEDTRSAIPFGGKTVIKFGGRTNNAQIPPSLSKRLTEMFAERYDIFPTMFDGPVCLYGEGYGPGTTKGSGKYTDAPDFVLFDVKIGDWWLERTNVEDVAGKLGLRVVPILGVSTLPAMIDYVRGGFKSTWGDFPAEGIVAQPVVPMMARSGHRIIGKLKSTDFPS